MKLIAAASAVFLAGQAHALTAYSLGGETGFGSQVDVVTFDTPNAAGVTETDGGPVGSVATHMGTSNIAAAPVGDTGLYEALQPGGSAVFNFAGYGSVGQLSVYVGSVDAYNAFEVSTTTANYFYDGSDFLNHNGDQSSLETNREVHFWAGPNETIKSITFGSSGIAFEYDDIAVGPYQQGQGVPPVGAEVLLPSSISAVPETATWALMLIGMTGVGSALRLSRRTLALAA